MKAKKNQWLKMYENMLRTRIAEEYIADQYDQREMGLLGIWGPGLEAVGVGCAMALNKEDALVATHRGLAEYIGKGMSVHSIYAERLGKKTGCCKGKVGVQSCDIDNGVWGVSGLLGTDFSLTMGIAMGFKHQGENRIACKYFGEGAYPQADWHPTMLMSVLWKVPVIYVLCQNEWVQHTHYSKIIPTKDIYKVAEAHGLQTFYVENGNDIFSVYDAVSDAAEWARSGKGPAFVECKTYRVGIHYQGDPGGYQPAEEIARWKANDPIDNCRNVLFSEGLLDEVGDLALKSRLKEEAIEAFDRALVDPVPEPEELTKDVYAE